MFTQNGGENMAISIRCAECGADLTLVISTKKPTKKKQDTKE